MPEALKDTIDAILRPTTFFLLSVAILWAMIRFRGIWTRGRVAGTLLLASLLFFFWSLTDEDFVRVVAKPDNIPISMLILAVGFFLWLAFRKMVINDDLTARGLPTYEARESKHRVFCWPDLLYSEFLALIIVSIILLIWAYYLKAPLEEPAHPTKTTNPSKAPWYFLGLQEMLVYFDPWLAGVVFPSFIIVGLMALPYLDPNPRGNGYFTFAERPFAITVFLFGFVVLWVTLIILGTFLRGPNWNFFGPYAYWDPYKVESLNNVNLSEYFHNGLLGQALPSNIFLRESLGIVLVLLYFGATPFFLANTLLRRLYARMGFIRFNVMVFFLLSMAALPIKMVLRWTVNLKYVVAVSEWSFNI